MSIVAKQCPIWELHFGHDVDRLICRQQPVSYSRLTVDMVTGWGSSVAHIPGVKYILSSEVFINVL